ncbi:MAG TPA: penicillin acylase family protein [Solirubrobacteraceae bacterium]|nr:penicillin acylase family protein [Solirubrobacteraceae bacterium]
MRRLLVLAVAAVVLPHAAPAGAAAPVQPYQQGDFLGFRDVLPPGANGHVNRAGLTAFAAAGLRPANSDDQLDMYRGLVHAVPGLAGSELPTFFKDASFGVRSGDAARTYSPGGRDDVTVVRDRSFGVAHVYATTRAGAMYGIGYTTAEERLYVMDLLRHLGRGQLSSFAGGSAAHRAADQVQWAAAPYTEADLQAQLDAPERRFGAEGAQLRQDVDAYVAGVNRYVAEARLDASKLPGEYASIGRPAGPDPWRATDVVATAAVGGVLFGRGGGGEVGSAQLLQAWQARFGRSRGTALWRRFGGLDDPEAPTTVRGARFDYQGVPRTPNRAANAIPDAGSVTPEPLVEAGVDARSAAPGPGARALLGLPRAASNALLVSARESHSGHPLAVFGPQVGYASPAVLVERDVHAPGLSVRGAALAGANLYVQFGRGPDYAWSATSAGQDIADTFAVELCDPTGAPPARDAAHYVFRGQCVAMEVLRRTNSWTPSSADPTPAGSQTLRALRTRLGLVRERGTLRGRPVAYVELRSTYFHELDSHLGFAELNNPDLVRGSADFRRAAAKVAQSLNLFYADDRDIAYFGAGAHPVRPDGVDPQLPTRASFEWTGWDPDQWTAAYAPPETHPQAGNQGFIVNWNNRPAPGHGGGYSSRHRVQTIENRLRRGIAGGRRMDITGVVAAMESAATVDVRGYSVLPEVLAVLGTPRDPSLAEAVATLRDWRREGAYRRDQNSDGTYENAQAIAIMDAWWPRLLEAQFRSSMGARLFEALRAQVPLDSEPNGGGEHQGSAFAQGWYGFASKDLRTLLRRRVRGRYPRVFCGAGNRARCRRALSESLRAALLVAPETLYQDPLCANQGRRADPWCHDAIVFRRLGGIEQPLVHWQNRPSYQQAVEVQGHR